ncbi:(S)-benzoin forming benzil reductase [Halobacillus salinarum]|uniref:(S)-benzoin forming benzil reductase n=1 Tax=Halobacillus salinarum TaxID=2932257 RepID=A0ABY4EI59_9BACI|nr:(S)-benzoin forming benzil reductase [Halobacillus salinarum]UOQ43563.1 (S)-benzoin forming benzil reductase [Halobacillus salinarum]
MHYAIVTGDSRGIGEAFAKKFIEKNVNIVGISRTKNQELEQLAAAQNVEYKHFSCDLSEQNLVENCLEQVVKHVFHEQTHYVYLINNAGVIEPVEKVGRLQPDKLLKHLQINVAVPMLLFNRCLYEANQHGISSMLINITSGAAEKSVHGWSVYSSGKAAINKFTETAAMEQRDDDHIIFAFSPGVVDTDMQSEIRASSKEAFQDVEDFRQLKEEGKLRSPDTVAAVFIDLVNDPKSIKNGKVYRLYDLI